MIQEYQDNHWQHFTPRQSDQWLFDMYDVRFILRCAAKCWLISHGESLAIVGCRSVYQRPAVGETFILPDEIMLKKYPRLFIRDIIALEGTLKHMGYWRLQTTGPVTDLQDRWMHFLGYEKEGTMRQYTERREDVNLYGRLLK